MGPAAAGLKAGGGVLSLMGGLSAATGYENAAGDVLQAGASTAGQLRQSGQRKFTEGQINFQDTKRLKDVNMSDFDAAVGKGGGGAGDPSVVKRRAQISERYDYVALRQLVKGKQDQFNAEFAADETERGAMRQANAYQIAAQGSRISAWGGFMNSMVDGMTLFGKYGSAPGSSGKVSVSPKNHSWGY